MDSTVWVALIGAASSIFVTWLTVSKERRPESEVSKNWNAPVAVLALGLSMTAIVAGAVAYFEARSGRIEFIQKSFAAETNGYKSDGTLVTFEAPNVPAEAKSYELNMRCSDGFEPFGALHEITGSHPAIDVLYSVSAFIEEGKLFLSLRAREGAVGYAYIKVTGLCRRPN